MSTKSIIFTILAFAVSCRFPAIAQESMRDTLQASIIRAQRDLGANIRTISANDFSVMASATGEADFVKYVQTLPGIAMGADGGSAYYVRGGNLGGNLQTLDGVPVYGASHLLGLASSYPLDVISSADFQIGGFTSEEGNLTSSHIKLASKSGDFDKFSAKAQASNFLLGGVVSTPLVKDRLSLIASLRVSPLQWEFNAIEPMIDDGLGLDMEKAAVYDVYAKLVYKLNGAKRLSLSVFNSLDSYKYKLNDNSHDSMSWGNLIASLRYDAPLWKRSSLSAGISYNHFSSSQGMVKRLDLTDNDLLIRSSIDEGILQMAVQSPAGKFRFRYGAKLRYARFNPGSARVLDTDGLFFKTSSPLADHISTSFTGILHAQMERGDLSKNYFRLSGRLNYNSADGLAPEGSVLLRLRPLRHFGLELTADALVQYYHTLEGIPLGWSLDMIVPSSSSLHPEEARQAYAGVFAEFGLHRFSAGGYMKEMENLVWFSDASKLFDSSIAGWEQNIDVGTGTSKGIELLYEKIGPGPTWKLAYTLSRTDRTFPELNEGRSFPAKYDRRHIFNATLSVPIMRSDRMSIDAGSLFTYQSGHWETVTAGSWYDDNFVTGPVEMDFYTSLNNYEMPPYIRLDVSVDMHFLNRRHPQELSLGVYNVLNRHNPSWLSYDADTREWKQVSLLPIMPSLKYGIFF